ncbi:MAG TPA: hypothetical protein VKV74_08730 [Bryobacteraceae bacterium]|nr:hypothetical protein [Bryobacteraceae bacterium]
MAQYPGGPFPGGGGPFPGGRFPGNPYPNGGQPQGSGRGNGTRSAATGLTTTTEGVVRRCISGQLVIQPDDHRIVWYRLTGRTSYQKDGKEAGVSDFAPGDRVSVDSTEDDEGNFTATEVRWLKAGTGEERAAAAQDWDLPRPASSGSGAGSPSRNESRGDDERPILRRKSGDSSSNDNGAPAAGATAPPAPAAEQKDDDADLRPTTLVRPPDPPADPDDPGRPQLRRGAPARRPQANSMPVITDAPANAGAGTGGQAPAQATATRGGIVAAEDPVISKAREVAFSYVESLPNFYCQQLTTRYQSDNPKTGWRALDIVSADVTYEDGRESYKNIKVGGRAVNRAMEDIEGTRSTGEFATVLVDLLSPATGASFKRDGQDTIRGRTAWVYKFEVPRERSHWRIEAPSQLYYPAFRGSVWIDKETSRVLRIEQEARAMPLLFPFDTVETATDYDFVRLAANEQFLLPTESEVLNCQRGTSECARNKIEFRNYRKFDASSTIKFEDAPQN